MRTIVDLPDAQLDALARICREQKISRAEAICRAVDRMIQQSEPTPQSPQREAGFGLWKHKPLDGRKFADQLRSEWSER